MLLDSSGCVAYPIAMSEPERPKNEHAVKLARLRALRLSPERRSAISRLGAIAANKVRAVKRAIRDRELDNLKAGR